MVTFTQATCLLLGESNSFLWLADQLDGSVPVVLLCEPQNGIKYLILAPSDVDSFMSIENDTLKWLMSQVERSMASDQLRKLAFSEVPAHIYLDPIVNKSDIQIIASKAEYDPEKILSA